MGYQEHFTEYYEYFIDKFKAAEKIGEDEIKRVFAKAMVDNIDNYDKYPALIHALNSRCAEWYKDEKLYYLYGKLYTDAITPTTGYYSESDRRRLVDIVLAKVVGGKEARRLVTAKWKDGK